ncbi:mitochondrial carrier domain-containing protein [Thermoascus aurantiacus ATCC 26904]
MSLSSRVFSLFTSAAPATSTTDSSTPSPPSNGGSKSGGYIDSATTTTGRSVQDGVRTQANSPLEKTAPAKEMLEDEYRPPYLHAMLAGGIGGTSGDMLMHSLDTVKTRQQGDPHIPPKYTSMSQSYMTILRQEGIRRGLYGGVTPALIGSFPGTVIFFGVYEWSKRHMLDAGVMPSVSYLAAGFLADLAASVIYVPSEVLKTRLQLQGRYNNPYFHSGYNYRSTADAFRTIIRQEGFSALFYGYKATIFRDLPFSALQFAFYEQEQKLARQWVGSRDIGLGLEILTATTAGGMAGVLTCPLDVVKTRVQTQQNPSGPEPALRSGTHSLAQDAPKQQAGQPSASGLRTQSRPISASTPAKPGAQVLDTSSVLTGLKEIYKSEGLMGLFRGVGPRGLWTSVQSGTMLVLYQYLVKKLDAYHQSVEEAGLMTKAG